MPTLEALKEHDCKQLGANPELRPLALRFRKARGEDGYCVNLRRENDSWHLETSYYVGADWLLPDRVAVRVQPKLNDERRSVDHLKMFFACLEDSEVAPFVGELYQLDVDAPFIELAQHDDTLTPLLVAHLLHLLREVIKQGLKKGYNPVVRELRGRIKGKIKIASTLQQNALRQRPLIAVCSFEEFTQNIPENRILKQALRFSRHYIQAYPAYEKALEPLLNYCEPAFALVSDEAPVTVDLLCNANPLYRAYNEALRVAQLLLKRFGYSLLNIETTPATTVHVPPHWIDMANLFELYVLGLLRKRHGSVAVAYGKEQAAGNYGLPDFLLRGSSPWIIDTKYKRAYQNRSYLIDDVRQLSGYARDRGVLKKLGIVDSIEQNAAVIRCLIVYPQQLGPPDEREVADVISTFPSEEAMVNHQMPEFTQFYKVAIKLPEQ